MPPDLIAVSEQTISSYLSNLIGEANNAESAAYLKLGSQSYAVGRLGQVLNSPERLREAKFENAIVKIGAIIGLIAEKESLPSVFDLNFACLLPYDEYASRHFIEKDIREKLSHFTFRNRARWVKLKHFDCLPEGGGLLTQGLLPKNPPSQTALILMWGYRNVTYLYWQQGNPLVKTNNLGFSVMLERVGRATIGLSSSEICETVFKAGINAKKGELKKLVVSQDKTRHKEELERLVQAVKEANLEHLMMFLEWLDSQKINPYVEEVILSGGTSVYYQSQLIPKLKGRFPHADLHWANNLEQSARELVPEENFDFRFTDVMGLWEKNLEAQNNYSKIA